MRALVVAGLFGVGALAIAGIGHQFTPAAHEQVRHDRVMNRIAEERAQQWQNDWQPAMNLVLFASGALVLVGGAVGLTIAAVGFPAAGVVAARNAAANVAFDRRFAMAQLQTDTQKYIAQQQYQHALPPATYSPSTSLTYAPAPRFSNNQEGLLPSALEGSATVVPTFAELLTGRKVGPGHPLLFGYDTTGKPIEGSWLDLYSTAIGGLTGSGKTWTAAFLIAQSMMHNGRALVIDPHAGDSESLSTRLEPLQGRMIAEPASSPRDMLATVKLVQSEYERRKQSNTDRVPWLLVCDEFSSLMRGELAEPLALLLEAIAQEGRKLHIYALALGQNWKTTRTGGGELRDSFASAFIHRIRPAQAKMITGMAQDDLPRDLLELPPGTSYLLSNAGELRKVRCPMCTAADLQTVAGLLSNQVASDPHENTGGKLTGNGSEGRHSPLVSGEVVTPQDAHIVQLLRSGKTPQEITRELSGSRSGRAYNAMLSQVNSAIFRAVRGEQERAVGDEIGSGA